eukprot:765269-Hanusia_phi.AAC.4
MDKMKGEHASKIAQVCLRMHAHSADVTCRLGSSPTCFRNFTVRAARDHLVRESTLLLNLALIASSVQSHTTQIYLTRDDILDSFIEALEVSKTRQDNPALDLKHTQNIVLVVDGAGISGQRLGDKLLVVLEALGPGQMSWEHAMH